MRQAVKPVLALQPAELEMPAPMLESATLPKKEESESIVDVSTMPRELGKD